MSIIINDTNVSLHKDNLRDKIYQTENLKGLKLVFQGRYSSFKVYKTKKEQNR